MKIKGITKIIGLVLFSFLLSGCSGSEGETQVSAGFIEEQADILMEEKEYYEAQTLYEVLKSEYEVDVEKKLGECIALIKDKEALLEFDEVVEDFNFEEDEKYILEVDPNYESEDMYGTIFKSKAVNFDYDEFMKAPKEFLNKRISGMGAIYKVIMQEEDYIEFLVNLDSNSTGSYNPNDTSKLVKISHKFANSNFEAKEDNNTMFYGYFMGLDTCELKDGTVKKVPSIKAVNITGLAG